MNGKPALITGGCGFVGRHLTKSLLERGMREIWIVDNLAIESGRPPHEWLSEAWKREMRGDAEYFTSNGRSIVFLKADAITLFNAESSGESRILPAFGDVFHLASIVGGRALIDADPLLVATDLGIDAAFFLWISRFPNKVGRVMYASSSAAYPIHLQGAEGAVALSEHMIDFSGGNLGQPD